MFASKRCATRSAASIWSRCSGDFATTAPRPESTRPMTNVASSASLRRVLIAPVCGPAGSLRRFGARRAPPSLRVIAGHRPGRLLVEQEITVDDAVDAGVADAVARVAVALAGHEDP